ncbi:MAG TPA: sulfite oxidase-like oxidoreductase [Acidimicrobiia bacterium]|jgi:DMSO/TMAO reductase YedYZ molybdopterin-dependent catalytic subunit
MSFLSRKRTDLSEQGVDAGRVPPGQYITERFPVLHAGVTPRVDLSKWDFQIKGLVETPVTFSYQDILNMPQVRQTLDIHCVTKWSKLDTEWEGVAVTELMSRVKLAPNVTHVLVMAEQGFTANLPLADFNRAPNLFAHRFGGEPLEPDHGWPLRLVVPHLYFWKSVKWVRGLQFLDQDVPGFWERNGYHMYGDPWREQRYWGD